MNSIIHQSPFALPDWLFHPFVGHADPAAQAPSAGWPDYDLANAGDGRYRVTVALPGVNADDLTVETDGAALRVRGERRDGDAVERLHTGLPAGRFQWTLAIGTAFDVDAARLENGLLTVDLVARGRSAGSRRRIKVRSGGSGPWRHAAGFLRKLLPRRDS